MRLLFDPITGHIYSSWKNERRMRAKVETFLVACQSEARMKARRS